VTKRKRLAVALIVLVALIPAALLANWLLAPLTLPSGDLERHLVSEVLQWYAGEPGSHQGRPVHLGMLSGDELRDFAEDDMAFWTGRGYEVRPASSLEPCGLGEVRDKVTKQEAHAVLLEDYAWVGRNTVEINIVLRSGFCMNGATLALSRNLWGWSLDGVRPFHDF
jgi:hypothetical protein